MQNCVKFVFGEKRLWQCNSQIEIGIPYKAAQIEMFAIPKANEIKLCICYLHRRPIVSSPHHHILSFYLLLWKFYFIFLSSAIGIVKMKNYYANDNIMRIICEHGANLLHIIGWWMRILSHNKKLRRLGDLYLKRRRYGARGK